MVLMFQSRVCSASVFLGLGCLGLCPSTMPSDPDTPVTILHPAGSLIRWFAGSLVDGFAGSLVRWFADSLVRWFAG